MNVVDSSAWLEFFADGPNAAHFVRPITDVTHLVVPSITILEVFKRVLQQRDENAALRAAAAMRQGRVAELDVEIALAAAKLGHVLKLPLADSVIFATSQAWNAVLWTQDADFKNLEGVRYFPKA
ncbi:MAG TPA: type II toxin-antitoxin system VapC family toxin [Gammaproteobacteria bacterium]|nr:type II toxin-antitoxin system VapC family toxin [Gammaproteobacteria bacterium]